MNYAVRIVNYLGDDERDGQVLLVAGAPPVEKNGNEVKIVFNAVLTPDDIRDTLQTFSSHVRRTSPADLGSAGIFSFGMPRMGRFRVHYLTQRGSMIVCVQRMPFDIPSLEELLADPMQVDIAQRLVGPSKGGLLLFTGTSSMHQVELAYALMAHVNETRRTVICICEQNLSYTLRHRNSVVMQIELGTDVSSLDEAMKSLGFMHPGILFVRNCRERSDFASLVDAAESGTLVLASLVYHDDHALLDDLKVRLQDDYAIFRRHLLGVVGVGHDPSGKIKLSMMPHLAGQGSALK